MGGHVFTGKKKKKKGARQGATLACLCLCLRFNNFPHTFNHQHTDVITPKDICTFHLLFFVIKEWQYVNEEEEGLRWSLNKQANWLMNDASLLH